MRPRNGGKVLTTKVLVALAEVGPMSMEEIAAFTYRSLSTCRWEVRAHRKAKLVRIASWERPVGRGKWRPIYGLGGEPDTVHHTPTHATHCRRHRARKRAIGARVSSVFNLGQP